MRNTYRIAAVYHTNIETVYLEDEHRYAAFPTAFVFNILSDHISNYEAEKSDRIHVLSEALALQTISDLANSSTDEIPVICAYDLMLHLRPLLFELEKIYHIRYTGQTSTTAYTVDLVGENGSVVLRFWDVSHLDPRGIEYFADAVGLKADDVVRVIPAYLRMLLGSYNYITEADLGCKVITRTSLVRLFGKRVISKMSDVDVYKLQAQECERERPRRYEQYAIRKAASRGGLAFTSALNAGQVMRNVVSLDVVSMHHAYMRRYVPCKFIEMSDGMRRVAKTQLEKIGSMSVSDVLAAYHQPFDVAINACVHVKNLQLKAGSVFERDKIGTLAISKMHASAMKSAVDGETKQAANEAIFERGYYDKALDAVECYGKLMSADEAYIYVTEVEYWIMRQVYDFELVEVVCGEVSYNSVLPPDLILMMSAELYATKQELKNRIAECSDASELEELELLYSEIVKPMYNAIYGTQVQDVNKPEFRVTSGGVVVDTDTVLTDDNTGRQGITNFNYGSRIVAGSRMHLVISLILIFEKLGDKVTFVGGDTDSIYISMKSDVESDILEALRPLHRAVDEMKARGSVRLEKRLHELPEMDDVGHFEVVGHYDYLTEYWNKCRVGINGVEAHYTAAGVARPLGAYDIEKICCRMLESGIEPADVLDVVVGYNTTYMPSVSFILGQHVPNGGDVLDAVIELGGRRKHVHAHETVACWPIARTLGEITVASNRDNLKYKAFLGQEVRIDPVVIYQDERNIYVEKNHTLLYKIEK